MNEKDSMAEFTIGEKTVVLTATTSGYVVKVSTSRNSWVFKSFGMKVADYRQAMDYFSETVRAWLAEYM